MSKFDSPEGQEAWSKLQVCARAAHALGRHKYTVEFIGFCPDCQASADLALELMMSVDWPTSFDAMEDLTEYTARRDGVLFGQRVA